MIDWLTFRLSLTHRTPINDGHVVAIKKDGSIDWQTCKKLKVRGSYESSIQVKTDNSSFDTDTGYFKYLTVDGNPTKWLQGHNIFGTDDIKGLVIETALILFKMLSLKPTKADIDDLMSGKIELYRVDINKSYSLQNQANVLSFIRAAEYQAHLRHRGSGIMKGKTLYFGKHSRRSSIKMYSKKEELTSNKKGHSLPADLGNTTSLLAYTNDKLRIELTLRAMELKDIKLNKLENWQENTPVEIYKSYISRLKMSKQINLKNDELEKLSPKLKIVYKLWKSGEDLRALYPKNTFYRHRRSLLKHDIDISIIQPSNQAELTSNVVPFVKLLEAVPVEDVPEWAIGTPLYFEPKYYA